MLEVGGGASDGSNEPHGAANGEWARSTGFERRYALALMALVSASQMADRQLLSIVMEPLKREFGLSDTQMGFLNGTVFGTAYAVGVVPFAVLADRWSRKKIIAATLAFWSLMTAFTAAAGSYAALIATRALVGVGEAGAGPAILALLANKYPPDKRSGMVALLTVATSLSAFAAFWTAGVVVDRFGWRPLFLIFGLPGLLLAVVIWWSLNDRDDAPRTPPGRSMPAEVRLVLFQAPLLHLFAVAAWNGIISAGTQGWMSSYLVRTFDMTFSSVGFWLGTSAAVAGVVGALFGGFLTNALSRRDPLAGMRLSLVVVTLNLPLGLGVFLAPSQAVAIALLLVSSTVIGISGPPIASQLLNFMPDSVRATVMAILSMGILLAAGFGPAVVGLLSDWLQGRGAANGLRGALLIICCLGVVPVLHLVALVFGRSRGARPVVT